MAQDLRSVVAPMVLYLSTGVLSTATQQVLVYSGASGGLLIPFFTFLGMALVGVLPDSWTSSPASSPNSASPTNAARGVLSAAALMPQSPRPVSLAPIEAFLARHLTLTRAVALSIAFEISGFSVSMAGLRLAGSGIYQVVHASVVVFSALLSWLVRRKVLNRGQWGGILLVTVGLAVSALGEHTHTSSAGEVVTGVLLTLFGSIIYAGNYTLLEVCSHALESPSPRVLAPRIGTGAATALALYVCIFTLPSWDSVYAAPVAKAGGASSSILAGYVVITVSSLAHSVSYFGLLGRVGAVSVGVLQSLRAVAVFLLSAVLFCASQESQCLSLERSVACVTVAGGVILYAYSKAESGVASPASSASATDLPSAEAEKLKVTSLGPASSRSARDPDDTL